MRRLAAGALTLALAVASGSAASRTTSTPPNAFACYPAQFSIFRQRSLPLVDQIALPSRADVVVLTPNAICAPVRAAGAAGTTAGPTYYLTCYDLNVATTGYGTRTVATSDRLGKSTLTVSPPPSLCIPSVRVDEGGSTVALRDVGWLTCYAAKASPRISRTVAVTDPFGTSEDPISGPSRLCGPAAMQSRPLTLDRNAYVTCYLTRSATLGATVIVRNALGLLKASLGPRSQLCVGATA